MSHNDVGHRAPYEYLENLKEDFHRFIDTTLELDLIDEDRNELEHLKQDLDERNSQLLELIKMIEREFDAPGCYSHIILNVYRLMKIGFFIGQHTASSQSTWKFARNKQSHKARKMSSARKDIRKQIAKPFIVSGTRKSDGSLLNPQVVLRKINAELEKLPRQRGNLISISGRTLARYAKEIGNEGHTDTLSTEYETD